MLSLCLQHIGLLIASFLNALLSAACCTGLLLAISITVAHSGQGLMLGCNDTQVPINARSPVSAQCPFDTTRIYVSLNVPLTIWLVWMYDYSCSVCDSQAKHDRTVMVNLVVLLYVSGHHPGALGPLCCVGSGWGRPVCLVLHRWIGSQRAGTLWEQLHQRAGVCLCVGGWLVMLEDVSMVFFGLNPCLIQMYTHILGLTQTHRQLTYTHLLPPSYSAPLSQKNMQTPFLTLSW